MKFIVGHFRHISLNIFSKNSFFFTNDLASCHYEIIILAKVENEHRRVVRSPTPRFGGIGGHFGGIGGHFGGIGGHFGGIGGHFGGFGGRFAGFGGHHGGLGFGRPIGGFVPFPFYFRRRPRVLIG